MIETQQLKPPPQYAHNAHKSEEGTFTAVFRYLGEKPEPMALKRLLKLLLRSFDFRCVEIVSGDWRATIKGPSVPQDASEAPEAGTLPIGREIARSSGPSGKQKRRATDTGTATKSDTVPH